MITSSSLPEGRRQAYLAALGIPLWTVRHELPYAAPAAHTQFMAYEDESLDVVEVESAPEVEEVVAEPPMRSANADLSAPPVYDDEEPPLEAYFDDPEYQQAAAIDGFKQVIAPPPVAAKTAPSPVVIPAASADQPIHFKFGVYACGPWQLIVPRSQLLSPSEALLLANIQRALQTTQVPPILFTWPMVNNYAIPRHKQAAQEALMAFFNNQAISDKGYILLADYDDDLAALLVSSTMKTVTVQASLSTLLQQPLQKKALWLALNQ
jgi:hypothetical protein